MHSFGTNLVDPRIGTIRGTMAAAAIGDRGAGSALGCHRTAACWKKRVVLLVGGYSRAIL